MRIYVRGLLSEAERKNGWTLAEAAGDVGPERMQRLLNFYAWDTDGVRDEVRASVVEAIGDDRRGVLVIDETGFLKKGVKSAGAARQFAHLAGQKLPPIRDVLELSGVESVKKAPLIPDLDFVTAPNEIVADALLKRFEEDSRTCGSYRICVDEMVVVARHSILEPLKGAGLLTRPADTDCARFDMHTYLRYFLAGGKGGLPLKELPGDLCLRYSDPKSAGGGVMLLMMLVDLYKKMTTSYGEPSELDWLLESSGPMFATGSAGTSELFDELTNGSGPHLAFVYEHDAIAFLSKPQDDGPYVMLRTNPYARPTQKLIGVTPAGMKLGSRFDPSDGQTGPSRGGLPELLNRKLHLRSVGYNDAVERDFRTGPFRTMLLPSEFATQTERRLEQTALPNFAEIRDLIARLP